MDHEAFLEDLRKLSKTRNLLKIRELLIGALVEYAGEPELLSACLAFAEKDPLIFRQHDGERISPYLDEYSVTDFNYLRYRLEKNFSAYRYRQGITLALHFEKLRQEELAEAQRLIAEQEAEALRNTPAEKKRIKKALKKEKKQARRLKRKKKRNEKDWQVLVGTQSAGLLLLYMVIQLLITEYYL